MVLPRYQLPTFAADPYRSDTLSRHELHEPPPPPNQLPAPARRLALDMTPDSRDQNPTSKPDPRSPGSVSWGVGNGGVHETESGTSHIQLYQPDAPMLLDSLRPKARKWAGPDSSPEGCPAIPALRNASHGGRSPKPPGPQCTTLPHWRDLAPIRGNLTLGM